MSLENIDFELVEIEHIHRDDELYYEIKMNQQHDRNYLNFTAITHILIDLGMLPQNTSFSVTTNTLNSFVIKSIKHFEAL